MLRSETAAEEGSKDSVGSFDEHPEDGETTRYRRLLANKRAH